MAEQTPNPGNKPGQEKVGEVTSTKMAKTIVVEVTRRVPHPMYKRIVTKKKKFYAHDEEQSAKVGDVVRILEHRPLSKLKRWKLGEVIRRPCRSVLSRAVWPIRICSSQPRVTRVLRSNYSGNVS